MKAVKLTKLVQEMNLKNLTPEVDMEHVRITLPDINRPALQLTGYFEHFASERVQIIGYVEYTYLMHLNPEERKRSFENFVSKQIPCVIFTTMTEPDEDMLDMGRKYNVPILVTEKTTSNFMAEIIRWLNVQLAPCISIHGVLVDVYGEGVLIMGESGIGKSEAALELIKRGHRLIADDAVEIRRVSAKSLVGQAPENIRHFIELRGIGIINARRIFGMGAVKMTEKIDIVINMELWDPQKVYDRMGLDNEYTEILGIKVPVLTIPVKPGRNLAVIIEVAAMKNRQKKMGYNAAKELYRRVQENLMKGEDDDE